MNKRPAPMTRTLFARRHLPMLLSVALLAGCAVGPDYERPAFDLASLWSADKTQNLPTQGLRKADTAGERWWSLYADPVLDALIGEALDLVVTFAIARTVAGEQEGSLSHG